MKACRCWVLMLPAILLGLTACGPVDFSRHAAGSGKSLHGTAAKRTAGGIPETTGTLLREIRRQLGVENYQTALNMLRQGVKGGMPETTLAEEYGRALNGVLGQAKLYRKRGLSEKAGKLFRSAYDGFPKTEAVAKKVSLTQPELMDRIEDCAAELMERGLVAYRSGDLDGAIRTWKTIHAFNPRHQASLKALKTAEVQRANLEKVGPKK